MPFKSFFKKDKKSSMKSGALPLTDREKKSLFGLKAIQAQQNPEPIYDLSGCSAPILPDDTYTFCRLLGKTTLNIKGNALTSLDSGGNLQDLSDLHVLDTSDNKLDKLPTSISSLQNLKILILSNNSLKSLPDSFAYLNNLEELDISQNKLSKVPKSICALSRIRVLNLKSNNITEIPLDFCNLQKTLVEFLYDNDKFKDLLLVECIDTEHIMKHLCNKADIEYTGLDNSLGEVKIYKQDKNIDIVMLESDDIMMSYIKKKDGQLRARMLIEENMRAMEKKQIESVLLDSSLNKEEVIKNLPVSPTGFSEFEDEKQKKKQSFMELEEKSRIEETAQLHLYLNNTTNKESLLKNLVDQENTLQKEFESIVFSKDQERNRLLKDLSSVEEKTSSALEELLNCQPSLKSDDFINLIKEQDAELQKLISGHFDDTTELRQSDILKAMQESMIKDAYAFAQRERTDETQKSWVLSLINEGEIEESRLKDIMNEKANDQDSFIKNLLEEEEYQEKAFRILLSDMDMKRNDVIRQISLIEYELTRLSCLELRKKMCDVQYGSTTMINQRKTLVGLLESLFKAKNTRDKELDSWVNEMAHRKCNGTEDFWLLQYQSLMNLKPPVLAEAEENLDYKVTHILTMANVLHLIPVFAKLETTYEMLLDMSENDFSKFNIGSATYHSIQRALHNYLVSTKLTFNEPCSLATPSAPDLEEAGSIEKDDASAPPLAESFLESECVVCMNNECNVLFIPCGHICVCAGCCANIELCPLCRCAISNKYSVNTH